MSHTYMDDKKINVNLNVVEGHREKKNGRVDRILPPEKLSITQKIKISMQGHWMDEFVY